MLALFQHQSGLLVGMCYVSAGGVLHMQWPLVDLGITILKPSEVIQLARGAGGL